MLKSFDIFKILVGICLFSIFFLVSPSFADGSSVESVSKVPGAILAWVLACFALLKALSLFLGFIAEKTKNSTDNKIALWFSKILDVIQKIIDFITANDKPKK